jgi:predicted Zn-dependent protease
VSRARRLALLLAGLGLLGLAGASLPHLRAWCSLRRARGALLRRDFHGARADLEACLATWPRRADLRLLTARTCRRAGLPDEAEAHLDACRDSPEVEEARVLELALLRAQRGGLPEVEDYLRKQVEQGHPDAVLVLEVLTWEWMRTHRLPEARAYLDVWLGLSPDDPEALVRRGWVAERLFLFSGAVRDYEKALEREPGRDEVRLRLAEILTRTDGGGAGAAHYERLRESRPDDPEVLLGLARCRSQQGKEDEAEGLLDALLARHPGHPQALTERARLALARGQAARAERWLRKAAARAPHDREVVYGLARCLARRGKRAEAAAYRARLARIDEDRRRMHALVGRVLRSPRDAALRCEVGRLFLRNGFHSDGVRWLHGALQIDPECRPAHEALAAHHERQGNPEQAARHRAVLRWLEGRGP